MAVIQTSQLMLYREIIAVCSQIHTKHINTLCGQNVELLNVKLVIHIVTTACFTVNNSAPCAHTSLLSVSHFQLHQSVGQTLIFVVHNSKFPAVIKTVQEELLLLGNV